MLAGASSLLHIVYDRAGGSVRRHIQVHREVQLRATRVDEFSLTSGCRKALPVLRRLGERPESASQLAPAPSGTESSSISAPTCPDSLRRPPPHSPDVRWRPSSASHHEAWRPKCQAGLVRVPRPRQCRGERRKLRPRHPTGIRCAPCGNAAMTWECTRPVFY